MSESTTTVPVRRRIVKRRAAAPRTAAAAAAAGVASAPPSPEEAPRSLRRPDEEEQVTRISRGERAERGINLPRHRMRQGRSYQFWPITVQGQPAGDLSPSYSASTIFEGGWRPEKAKDWIPELCMPGTDPNGPVMQNGQQLFSRPQALTDEAIREDYSIAERQKLDRIRAAQDGKGSGGESGLRDVRGVVPVNLGLEIEGEAGSKGPVHRGS